MCERYDVRAYDKRLRFSLRVSEDRGPERMPASSGLAFGTWTVSIGIRDGGHRRPRSNDLGEDLLHKLNDGGGKENSRRGSVLDILQLLFPGGSKCNIFESVVDLTD